MELLFIFGMAALFGLSNLFGGDDDGETSVEQDEDTENPPKLDLSQSVDEDSFGDRAATDTGTSGDDVLTGTNQSDIIYGLKGNDTMSGGRAGDDLSGDAGDDSLLGQTGDDTLFGGEGEDTAEGGFGDDMIWGGPGNDTLLGEDGQDAIAGEGGDDVLRGGDDSDLLVGGVGDDSLFGEGGHDVLVGEQGADLLKGNGGNDILDGHYDGTDDELSEAQDLYDPDVLKGGSGNDLLILGSGDTAQGDAGADIFATGVWVDPTTPPEIEDFQSAEDIVVVFVPVGATGNVAITEDPAEAGTALVSFDGQVLARVTGAFGSLTPSDVEVVEEVAAGDLFA